MYIASFAQPIIKAQRTIGGSLNDALWSICLTKDGGLIAGGNSFSNTSGEKTENCRGFDDYWIVKLNFQGKIEWDKTIGGSGGDNLKSVIQTSDGGYAIIGESASNISGEKSENSRGSSDYWLVKLDSLGNIQWDKTIGGSGTEYIDNFRQTSDDGYILAGSSASDISGDKTENGRGATDYWVVKLNKNGKIQWQKTIGGNGYEFCSPVELTIDGGVIIGGFSASNISGEKTENSRGDYDYWIVKLNSKGNIQWDKTIGGNDGDFCRGLKQANDGGYVLAGASWSNKSGEKTENSRGGADYWVVKLNCQGHVQWDKTIGGNADDNEVWCLEKTCDGGNIFGGHSASDISGEKTENSRGDYDYWVVKLDNKGNIQWDKTIGGSDYEEMHAVKEVQKNKYVIGGFSSSGISGDKTQKSRGEVDYWIVKLNYIRHQTEEVVSQNEYSLVKPNINANGFIIYPNPAKNILYVQSNGKAILSLTDQSGKILLTKTIDGRGSINISGVAAGLYYLKNNTTGATQKVVITK